MGSTPPYEDQRNSSPSDRTRRATASAESQPGRRAARSTVDHLRRALVASCAEVAPAVGAALTRAAAAIDENRYPNIAAAIRTARGVDPLSTTIRQYIQRTIRRLVAVVKLWEAPE